MGNRPEADIDQLLSAAAAEYDVEDRAVAEEESREGGASAVFSVRLPPDVYDAVRAAASRAHLTPSAVIRQWVTERTLEGGTGDLATAVAALRRDVDRVASLVEPAEGKPRPG